MRFPIRHQFLAPLAVVATVSLLTIALVNHRRATQQTRDRVQHQLRGVAAVLTERAFPLTERVLRQMAGLAGAEFVLTTQAGAPIAVSDPALDLHRLRVTEPVAETADDIVLGESIQLGAARYLHSAARVEARPGGGARSVLHVLFPQRSYDAAWRSAYLPPLVVGVGTIAASALAIQLVAGRLGRVLSTLGREVARLSSGDFSDVEQPSLRDETHDLAASINQAARQLRDYENELKRTERLQTVAMIGAGLAHEMRNAVTGCRLAIDLHREACQDPADESLQVARRQLVLVEGRLQELLQIGKTPEPARRESIDLGELVQRCVELVAPAARHKGISLDWDPPSRRLPVAAEPDLLAQAVTNVLLNALDASAKRRLTRDAVGHVTATVRSVADGFEVAISDNGVGPSAAAEDVFEPFVTEKPEGVGLGLAVAKRVVEEHRGHIEYDREEGRTVFRIRLPQTEPETHHASNPRR